MASLKNSWKNTGTGLGGAFKSLGKTLINSGKKGVDKAVEWAGREDGAPAPAQQPQQTASQPYPQQPQQTASQPYPQQPQQQTAPQPYPQQPQTAAPEEAETVSVAEEIRKLASLRDEGILTEEEYTAKKHQLLGI